MTGGHPTADPVRVLFLAGMGRSGSTLISRLAGQFPSVCAVGELCYLWDQGLLNNRTCGCGEHFADCPFWTAVGREAFGGWDHVDAAEALRLRLSVERVRFVPALAASSLGTAFQQRVARYTALTSPVYRAIRAVSGAELVVDSSKYPSSAYVLRRTPGVELRVAHLVRASQGVSHSWQKVVERPDREGRTLARFSPVRTAVEWDVYNVMLESLRALGVPCLRLRYEDFVAAPTEQLTRLLTFSGVDVGSDPFPYLRPGEADLLPDHSLAGNPNRFLSGPTTLRLDDRWRSDMPTGTRRLVTALTWPGLVRYRYPLSVRQSRGAR